MASKAAVKGALAIATAAAGAAAWWRHNPSPCPYGQRWMLDLLPRPFISRERLKGLLAPAPGERLLELGPGTGYYTLDVAGSVAPEGKVVAFDIQREMLAHISERAKAAGIDNLETVEGDAQQLPFEDDSFDGAFLVTVLGEIPDQDAALRELNRVVRPGGRVVVGEIFIDFHMVTLASLERRAGLAGLELDGLTGGRFAYFARLRPDGR